MSRSSLAFLMLIIMIALALTNIILIESRPPNAGLPLVKADFRACTTVCTGPIRRPDNYTPKPHGRKADVA